MLVNMEFSEVVTVTEWTEGSVLNLTMHGMTFYSETSAGDSKCLSKTGKCRIE